MPHGLFLAQCTRHLVSGEADAVLADGVGHLAGRFHPPTPQNRFAHAPLACHTQNVNVASVIRSARVLFVFPMSRRMPWPTLPTAELLREADHAADEAAREARAEVLEREGITEIPSRPKRSKRRQKKAEKQSQSSEQYHHFVVDVWLTNLNPTEFGIFKRDRNRAKSRQFTTDMDVFAEILENGERTGLIGYRKDLWTNKERTDKRLVFKLFTDKLHWRATMDLMLARSVSQTIGARLLARHHVFGECIR